MKESWEIVRDQYARAGRLSQKPMEDMLARRILRGLGGTESRVYSMERIIFGVTYEEDSLWTRATRMFMELMTRSRIDWLAEHWVLDAVKVSGDNDAVTRICEYGDLQGLLVLFTIPKGGRKLTLAYAPWPDNTELSTLTPPYKVLACEQLHGYKIVVQDAMHFVQQFGPFAIPVE